MATIESRGRQNSAYRSVRYSTIRKDSQTADPDQLSQFRIKRRAAESTFYNTRTLELKSYVSQQPERPRDNPERPDYLTTFHSLLHSHKQDEDDLFLQVQPRLRFTSYDHAFEHPDTTEFTLLDPFHRPYAYLTAELAKNEKELHSQREEMRLIRAQLAHVKQTAVASLARSEEEGRKGIERLRGLLKKNETGENERKMRVRRELTDLYADHDANQKLEAETSRRVVQLQGDIFSCHPFELEAAVPAD